MCTHTQAVLIKISIFYDWFQHPRNNQLYNNSFLGATRTLKQRQNLVMPLLTVHSHGLLVVLQHQYRINIAHLTVTATYRSHSKPPVRPEDQRHSKPPVGLEDGNYWGNLFLKSVLRCLSLYALWIKFIEGIWLY